VTFGAHIADGRAASPPGYVALGDSYTADPSVSAQAPGSPNKCERSAKNYPHLVAAALGLELTDASCGGAAVGGLERGQLPGVSPQFHALTATTQVVTVGIGGDDGNLFASLLNDCAEASLHPRQAGGASCGRAGAKLPRSVAADEPHLSGAYARIHERAPGAKVFVVGYPDVFTAHGACPKVLPFTRAANAFANSIEKDLNRVIKQAAEASGEVYVDTYSASVTRNSCAALDRTVRHRTKRVPDAPERARGSGHGGPCGAGDAGIRHPVGPVATDHGRRGPHVAAATPLTPSAR
jgi:hypothetical protein